MATLRVPVSIFMKRYLATTTQEYDIHIDILQQMDTIQLMVKGYEGTNSSGG